MKILDQAIRNPTGVIAGVILGAIMGVWSIFQLPIQLVPNVELYKVTVITRWASASPVELEENILKPQEDVLKGLASLVTMEASATQGLAIITLTFDINVDTTQVLIEITNRLARVPGYPPEVNQPQVTVGANANETAVAWLSVRPKPDNPNSVIEYLSLIENIVQPTIERIPGVAGTRLVGGQTRELRISFDPYRLAQNKLELDDLVSKLARNEDISAGYFEVGRRQYALRLSSQYSIDQMRDMIVSPVGHGIVRLQDVAEVNFSLADAPGVFSENGGQSIAISVQPQHGINIIQLMEQLKKVVAELDNGILANNNLKINQVYDESLYVWDSVRLVIENLLIGILLSVAILWWFIRKARSTLIIAFCIPLTLAITFAFLNLFGRTLNVISLAGMAFAVGLSLDAAIVVTENIQRHLVKSKSRRHAILYATKQVQGALFASAMTSVAVFLPIVFLRDVAGQLFVDLALSIATAVLVSLLIALIVIPAAVFRWPDNNDQDEDAYALTWQKIADKVIRLTDHARSRYIIILCCLLIPVVGTLFLLPSTDYLPDGKQNQIFAFIVPPPGLSLRAARKELTDIIDQRLTPYLSQDGEPKIENYWLGFFGRFGFLGATAANPKQLDTLINVINQKILSGFPDIVAYASRVSIFQRFGGSRFIDINLQGKDLNQLLKAAQHTYEIVSKNLPGAEFRPIPGLEHTEPEFRLIPNDYELNKIGWDRSKLARVVKAYGDGLWLGRYFSGDERLDIVLRAKSWSVPEDLLGLSVFTKENNAMTLGDLVDYQRVAGPGTVRHIDGQRTITIRVTPPVNVSIENTLTTLKSVIEKNIRPLLSEQTNIVYQGTVEDLDIALRNLAKSLLFALLVLFLLMATLFQSFRDAFVVLLTVPLASIGGIILLRCVNWITFQPMDLLTMIGFIILLGLVVNNAILLVSQTRIGEQAGLSRRDAIRQALCTRLRPIVITTLTTVFGLLPLLLFPGAGAELYRGLAAVIIGGMLINAVFVVMLIPGLLRFDAATAKLASTTQAAQPG